jgi:hypothetical protein
MSRFRRWTSRPTSPAIVHHGEVEGLVEALLDRRQRRARGELGVRPQDRKLLHDQPDPAVRLRLVAQLVGDRSAVAAAIVEELHDRDVAIRIADNGIMGILKQRRLLGLQRVALALLGGDFLLLLIDLDGLDHNLRMAH